MNKWTYKYIHTKIYILDNSYSIYSVVRRKINNLIPFPSSKMNQIV